MGAFGRLSTLVDRHLRDPRTRRVLSFQAMYAGRSPYDALALYAVISYMDCVAGVWFPVGGMHALPVAMAAAAQRHGVELRYGTTVTSVEISGDRAVAVHTTDGDRIGADVIVLSPDLPIARRDLLGRPLRRRLESAPSCFLLHLGSTATYRGIAHHNLHFGRAWRTVFDDLIGGCRLMADPSLLVTNACADDPSLAPPAAHTYDVLVPTPNLTAPIDWPRLAPRYRDEVMTTLEERGYRGLADSVEVEALVTPEDWRSQGMADGTPFAAAHSFWQTGPFRPGNMWGRNVVFAGSGTRPGVGVPMVLISGRLAAARITGAARP
jgi:phytoene desaturase